MTEEQRDKTRKLEAQYPDLTVIPSEQNTTFALELATNLKEFFIVGDGLSNFDTEINFSIFRKYTCKAKCHMCYVEKLWMPDDEFGLMVPTELTEETEAHIFDMFSYYNEAATIDDLFFVKRKYPHLYDFYLRNSHRMTLSSMTDNAFLQQFDLTMNEMNFQSVYDISFSDVFLDKQNGRMTDNVISRLTEMQAKHPITKLKFIICRDGERSKNVRRLITWAKQNGIHTDVHDDFTQYKNARYVLKFAEHQERNLYSDPKTTLAHVLCETLFLQHTDLYLTLVHSIEGDYQPFYNIDQGVDARKMLTQMLKFKLKSYREYRDSMIDPNNKFYDYFTYLHENLVVNDDFTFIPSVAIKPYVKLYQRLQDYGFMETKYGLVLKGATEIKPIYELKQASKQKLEYIPIKCEKVNGEADTDTRGRKYEQCPVKG